MKSSLCSLRTVRLAGRLGVLLLPLMLGCQEPGKSKVSGRVLFDGKPLPGGLVTFLPKEGTPVAAELDQNGNYAVLLPAGTAQITVDNEALAPRPPRDLPTLPPAVQQAIDKAKKERPVDAAESAPPAADRYVKIPSKYYDFKTSGLSITVTGSEQKLDIELTK
jgi:hypothetical protein